VNATGNATAGLSGNFSTGIVLKNGAFGVSGVHPAGHVTAKDFSGAGQTNVTINNPLCTTDRYVLITPRNLGAAHALLYVSSVADGSFVVTDALGAATASGDFDYFIITPVNR
jgi:hypothetical protein